MAESQNQSPRNLSETLKKALPWVLVVLCIAGAVASFLKPPKVEFKEKIEYRDREKIVKEYIEKKNEQEDKKEAQIIYVERVITELPDGTKKTEEKSTTQTDTNTVKTEVEIKTVKEYIDREVIVNKEVEKIVTNEKDWRVGVNAGTSVLPFPTVSPIAPYVDPLIIGVEVDRRIIGPVSVGLWVQTRSFKTLEVGLGVSVAF